MYIYIYMYIYNPENWTWKRKSGRFGKTSSSFQSFFWSCMLFVFRVSKSLNCGCSGKVGQERWVVFFSFAEMLVDLLLLRLFSFVRVKRWACNHSSPSWSNHLTDIPPPKIFVFGKPYTLHPKRVPKKNLSWIFVTSVAPKTNENLCLEDHPRTCKWLTNHG